ncbi:uncharacterized protein B0I36DRAFT_363213 [Microdochium trichocladiopsis]|uniref:Uncharacterized protein n=1 Tax=Microdochium trichocladiopsis TaxID=1682393 RepID=A0A9P9BUK4_9PEZI|nr:uncharacterized protein B0I36DRAFT_363213 [Microdochium trichocladiopsis]KAH7031534.1 hypothetical protein B0I36DRAFT_363213 [Microdochium trichocladiopsis]
MHVNLPFTYTLLVASTHASPTSLQARQFDPAEFISDVGDLASVITGVTDGITSLAQDQLTIITALPSILGGISTISGLLDTIVLEVPQLSTALPPDVQEQICVNVQPAIEAETALVNALNTITAIAPSVTGPVEDAMSSAQAVFVAIVSGVVQQLPTCSYLIDGGETITRA